MSIVQSAPAPANGIVVPAALIPAPSLVDLPDLGVIPSPELLAQIIRFRRMRAAWDEMADAALHFDTHRYERAKAYFNSAREC